MVMHQLLAIPASVAVLLTHITGVAIVSAIVLRRRKNIVQIVLIRYIAQLLGRVVLQDMLICVMENVPLLIAQVEQYIPVFAR